LRKLLACLAERAPVVLWIDDFQWTDAESLALLGDILQRPHARGVLLIASYRADASGAAEGIPGPRGPRLSGQQLWLGPLEPAALRTLLERSGSIETWELDAIVRETCGNPFFVSELVRARSAGHRAQALSLDALWAARMARFDPCERAYLEFVSIATRPLAESVLHAALGVSHEAALEARRVLIAASMIRMADSPDRAIEPYHDRIRLHVQAGLSPESSRWRHKTLAMAYEGSSVADSATLALQHRVTGSPAKPLACDVGAAGAALRGRRTTRRCSMFG
jgi:hypothetical protein